MRHMSDPGRIFHQTKIPLQFSNVIKAIHSEACIHKQFYEVTNKINKIIYVFYCSSGSLCRDNKVLINVSYKIANSILVVNRALVLSKSSIIGNSKMAANGALIFIKSNVSGNSKVAVAVLLVLTKSNISGNSKVAVAVLLVLTKSNISSNSKMAVQYYW